MFFNFNFPLKRGVVLSTRPECDVVVEVSDVGAGAEGSNFRTSAEVLLDEVEVVLGVVLGVVLIVVLFFGPPVGVVGPLPSASQGRLSSPLVIGRVCFWPVFALALLSNLVS